MAQPYLDELSCRLREWKVAKPPGVALECRHFFSGAAIYANAKIVASFTPVGLALKLPESTRAELIRSRQAKRLRYFSHGPVKEDYAVLSRRLACDRPQVRALLRLAIRFVCES